MRVYAASRARPLFNNALYIARQGEDRPEKGIYLPLRLVFHTCDHGGKDLFLIFKQSSTAVFTELFEQKGLYLLLLAGAHIMIPSQWSISCWMISAVQPVKVLSRVWSFSFCHWTLMV